MNEPTPSLSKPLTTPFDVNAVRRSFPILNAGVEAKPLIYLDSAATTQKPQSVIDAVQDFYAHRYANIHRGVHSLSAQATDDYESARRRIASFLGAESPSECVFVRGTTEAINLVVHSYGNNAIGKDDEIIISEMEHHANIVPWQLLAERAGAKLRVIPITEEGELDLVAYHNLLNERTRFVSVTHVSNALGTLNPVNEIISAAHARKIPVLIDGAQSAAHFRIDVREMDCDFFVCSGHKMFGPTGIGILYGKAALLEKMPPYQTGGNMIESVSFEKTTFQAPPGRFEAGTPHIAGVIGLGAAVDFIESVDRDGMEAHEDDLIKCAEAALGEIEDLQVLGSPSTRVGAISFVMKGIHPHDIGTILDTEGIAIRAGHHCAQPLMRRLGVVAAARASFSIYNTREEIAALAKALHKARKVFG